MPKMKPAKKGGPGSGPKPGVGTGAKTKPGTYIMRPNTGHGAIIHVGKNTPTSSQVHVPAPLEDDDIMIKARGLNVTIGKDQLTSEGRKHVSEHNFALPETRSYPIHDISHARNALARVSQHGTPEEKAKVRAAVYRKFPSLKPVAKSFGARRVASVAVMHGNHMLMGKRRDNNKWTMPGGHLEVDEDFPQGALRELLEETGIECPATLMKAISSVHRVKGKDNSTIYVQPFKVEMSERPGTSMMDDPDGEVHRWQWVDVSQGIPRDIAGNMHTPPERNCLVKAMGLFKPSDVDTSDEIYPPLNNLEAEVLTKSDEEIAEKVFKAVIDGEEVPDGDTPDNSDFQSMYDYQLLVEGMDWELEHTTTYPEEAQELAQQQLQLDPMHYRKLNLGQTDDTLAMKDLNENDQNPWEPGGLSVDLGSGQTREPGFIGYDTYPYDHGTVVHDLETGIPLPDQCVEKLRYCNVQMEDPKALFSEIHRVMMPGGQFVYEGPNDISNYPEWAQDYPGLVLTDHESNCDDVQKEGPGSNITRQVFTRVAVPDPATANDAEPRIGVSAQDWLPADALLAMDALSYYYSDATSSGRGNRMHGYPSQGALSDGIEQDSAHKESDSSGAGDSNQKVKRISYFKEVDHASIADQQVHDALNRTNPNPAPPKRLRRNVSKIAKALEKGKIVPIIKLDGTKQVVYGVVLAPNEIDAQDDFMEPDEIEKAAHRYLANSRIVGAGHDKPIKAYPVESFIAPQDFTIQGQYGQQDVKKGSWVLGVKIEDPEQWDMVKNGDYQGFSVGGFGLRDHV